MGPLAISLPHAVDLPPTLFPLRRGYQDPTTRIDGTTVWRTLRTPVGTATLTICVQPGSATARAEAIGPGAAWALETAPGLIGALDDDRGFDPAPGPVRDLWRRHRGVRITRTADVLPTVLAAVLEQKVTGVEARRAWRGLVRATSEPAPTEAGWPELWLPPDPVRTASLPYFTFHRFGVERRRAEVIRGIADRAWRVQALSQMPLDGAKAWLGRLPGLGPWTVAEVARLALGDADAVSVGDYHLPNLVAWVLAGEPRGTDERMLELLEPFAGHRGRVQLLLEAGGTHAPRFGPRMPVRSFSSI